MYRDELEAAQARVSTLTAQLAAGEQARAAAEAAARAARAETEELRLKLGRTGAPAGSRWVPWALVGLLVIGASSYLLLVDRERLRALQQKADLCLVNSMSTEARLRVCHKELSRRSTPPAPRPPDQAPETGTLTRAEIQEGMQKLKDHVQHCYDRFRVPGTAFVKLTIEPSGRIGSAQVTGQFADTPTGSCLLAVVRQASFRAFGGAPISINYPLFLR